MYYVVGRPTKYSINEPRFQYFRVDKERILREMKPRCHKKRQNFVHNPEEEISYEPYMSNLQKEYSDVSIRCGSSFEIPWRNIALPLDRMKIRRDVQQVHSSEEEQKSVHQGNEVLDGKDKCKKMWVAWNDLVIDNIVGEARRQQESLKVCDSSLEIPWEDLSLETPTKIKEPPKVETCTREDIEIPWASIALPKDIIIETKVKKHPSASTKKRNQKSINLDCKYSSCCDRCDRERNKVQNSVCK